MPIYEFHCEPCDHRFETLIRSAQDAPKCPKCGNLEVAKEFSVPAAAQGGAKSSSLPAFDGGGCGRPQCGGGFCAGMG
jgi:putative FmdB family regulatory protein